MDDDFWAGLIIPIPLWIALVWICYDTGYDYGIDTSNTKWEKDCVAVGVGTYELIDGNSVFKFIENPNE